MVQTIEHLFSRTEPELNTDASCGTVAALKEATDASSVLAAGWSKPTASHGNCTSRPYRLGYRYSTSATPPPALTQRTCFSGRSRKRCGHDPEGSPRSTDATQQSDAAHKEAQIDRRCGSAHSPTRDVRRRIRCTLRGSPRAHRERSGWEILPAIRSSNALASEGACVRVHPEITAAQRAASSWRVLPAQRGFNVWRFYPGHHNVPAGGSSWLEPRPELMAGSTSSPAWA
jgi:hypothetical protein